MRGIGQLMYQIFGKTSELILFYQFPSSYLLTGRLAIPMAKLILESIPIIPSIGYLANNILLAQKLIPQSEGELQSWPSCKVRFQNQHLATGLAVSHLLDLSTTCVLRTDHHLSQNRLASQIVDLVSSISRELSL